MRPPGRRRRGSSGRLARRVGLGVLVTLAITALGVVVGERYAEGTWDDVPSIEVDALAPAEGDATNYLLVGSDDRSFVETDRDAESFGPDDGRPELADVIMVVRVDRSTGGVLLVSIPRDTWVTRPDGSEGRINAAFSDGPSTLVRTLGSEFGIEINHYLEVDFAAVREIIDAVGGVDVFVDTSMRDALSGLDIQVPGPQVVHLDGDVGLAYVRARHLERLVDGEWQADPTADLGRIQRQQVFMQALANTAIQRATRNPWEADELLDRALARATVDEGLGLADALRLVEALRSLDPDDASGTTRLTIPTRSGRVGEASVLFVEPAADAVFARLRAPVPAPGERALGPGDVVVAVRNGTRRTGLAGATSEELGDLGFVPGEVGDAPAAAGTEVHHRPGDEEAARLVAGYVDPPAVLVADPGVGPGVDVVLVLGDDFERVVGG